MSTGTSEHQGLGSQPAGADRVISTPVTRLPNQDQLPAPLLQSSLQLECSWCWLGGDSSPQAGVTTTPEVLTVEESLPQPEEFKKVEERRVPQDDKNNE
ncbi:hypothetical protein Pmani_037667 [Petrolisthes manimaculis]|uniref:Uncharacterized protein n=1 Tax=Petrolisthes manimaculis TaxID=1843537 RepID=A0AAE1TN30_9EUCA|nr:hypothetical protein Pmani_037667 [Petrolisthes manimaculis]